MKTTPGWFDAAAVRRDCRGSRQSRRNPRARERVAIFRHGGKFSAVYQRLRLIHADWPTRRRPDHRRLHRLPLARLYLPLPATAVPRRRLPKRFPRSRLLLSATGGSDHIKPHIPAGTAVEPIAMEEAHDAVASQ